MDDSRQIGQSAAPVDSQAAVGSYYQPIGTDGALPPLPEPTQVESAITTDAPLPSGPSPTQTPISQPSSPLVAATSNASKEPIAARLQQANAGNKKGTRKTTIFVVVALVVLLAVFGFAWTLLSKPNQKKMENLPVEVDSKDTALATPEPAELSVMTSAAQFSLYKSQYPDAQMVPFTSDDYSGSVYFLYDSDLDQTFIWGEVNDVFTSEGAILKSWLVNTSDFYTQQSSLDVVSLADDKLVGYFVYSLPGPISQYRRLVLSYDTADLADGPGEILMEVDLEQI